MLLAVDPSAPLPAYEQIREQVARMVAAGTLEPGHRLPTIRQLAVDLGLAKGTVAKAYELLEAEAVIHTRGRKGSFVAEPPTTAVDAATDVLTAAAEAFVVTARQIGVELPDAEAALRAAWDRF